MEIFKMTSELHKFLEFQTSKLHETSNLKHEQNTSKDADSTTLPTHATIKTVKLPSKTSVKITLPSKNVSSISMSFAPSSLPQSNVLPSV
jgi:hypothetical protein